MNRFDNFSIGGKAKLKYQDGQFTILSPGDFVNCAVSGVPIRLDDLKYWNVERQEAYASAALSLQRFKETHK